MELGERELAGLVAAGGEAWLRRVMVLLAEVEAAQPGSVAQVGAWIEREVRARHVRRHWVDEATGAVSDWLASGCDRSDALARTHTRELYAAYRGAAAAGGAPALTHRSFSEALARLGVPWRRVARGRVYVGVRPRGPAGS
jgi:hypothetical protein